MKDEHIIELLDNAPLSSLSAEQLEFVRAHSKDCFPCGGAYQAAMASSAVIKGRAQTVIEPSPFFQTRVLAALREQQAIENVPAIVRLWRTAGGLVSSMAVTTVALAALSFMVPAAVAPATEQTAFAYSAESVILDQDGEDQMSDEQVLSTIYAEYEEAK